MIGGCEHGGLYWIRTSDLLLRRQALYPAELTDHSMFSQRSAITWAAHETNGVISTKNPTKYSVLATALLPSEGHSI